MAYPTNPPAQYYLTRRMLVEPVYEEMALIDGTPTGYIISANGYFWWEPTRGANQSDDDWIVGPYTRRHDAHRALEKYYRTQHLGDPVRVWSV